MLALLVAAAAPESCGANGGAPAWNANPPWIRIKSSGFGAVGLGFRVWGLGFGVWGLG